MLINGLDMASQNLEQAAIGQTQLKLNYLRAGGDETDSERLRGAARELEAYFIQVLIKEMRKAIPPNPLIGGGKAEEIFQGFLDEEIAAEMAKSNQLGLADLIFDSLKDVLKRKGGNADNSL